MPRFKSIIFIERALKSSYFCKKCEIFVPPAAGGFAFRPQPPEVGGFAPTPPKQLPLIVNFWLRASTLARMYICPNGHFPECTFSRMATCQNVQLMLAIIIQDNEINSFVQQAG